MDAEHRAMLVDRLRHGRPAVVDAWIGTGEGLVADAARRLGWEPLPGRWDRRGRRRVVLRHPYFGEMELIIREKL